jgi:hypothetical protein
VRHRDAKIKDHRLQALADSHALVSKPLFYRVRDYPRYLYTLNHFEAAAKSISLTGPYELARGGSLTGELTRKRIIPLINTVKSDAEVANLIESLRIDDRQPLRIFREDLGYDVRRYLDAGLLDPHNISPYRHLGRALGRSDVYIPTSTVVITQASLRGPDNLKHLYNVPATLEQGMTLWDCRRDETFEYICSTIHQMINALSLELSTALYRSVRVRPPFRNYILDDGLQEEKYQFQSAVRQALLISTLGDLHNIPGDRISALMYRDVALSGQTTIGSDLPTEERCQQLLSHLAIMWSSQPVWRGFSTALPVKYFGYGFMNQARRYLTEPNVHESHHHVYRHVQLSKIIDGTLSKGLNSGTSLCDWISGIVSSMPVSHFLRARAAEATPSTEILFPVDHLSSRWDDTDPSG